VPVRRVVEIGRQLCDALAHAHARGVIHRDLKPGNVIVDRQGRAKLLDFGIAKLFTRDPADYRLTETGEVVGTPKYIPPERYAGVRDLDARTDVYSLGVMLFELAGGKLGDYGTKGVAPLASVHPGLDYVLARAVASDRGERFGSVEEFGEALGAIRLA
jgi:serine/threonine protein kinase